METYIKDKDWLLLSSNDECAFRRIYDRYNNTVYKIAFKILKEEFLADEIVQDVFITIWEVRNRIVEWANPESVLYTIARNKTLNCLKIKAKEAERIQYIIEEVAMNHSGNTGHPIQKIFQQESQLLFKKLMDCLSMQERKVFLMSREEGYSYKEIAQILHVSDQTIKSQIAAALRKIRIKLTESNIISFTLIYLFSK